jgi:hypothetical protein
MQFLRESVKIPTLSQLPLPAFIYPNRKRITGGSHMWVICKPGGHGGTFGSPCTQVVAVQGDGMVCGARRTDKAGYGMLGYLLGIEWVVEKKARKRPKANSTDACGDEPTVRSGPNWADRSSWAFRGYVACFDWRVV